MSIPLPQNKGRGFFIFTSEGVYKKTKAYLTADLASLKVTIFTLTN
jgi:hypothetical protein